MQEHYPPSLASSKARLSFNSSAVSNLLGEKWRLGQDLHGPAAREKGWGAG